MAGTNDELRREATLIAVAEASKENVLLQKSSLSLHKVSDSCIQPGEERIKVQTQGTDKRSLLLILCLLTFEADYPEAFYDSICKSKLMKRLVSNLRTGKLTATSFQDLC